MNVSVHILSFNEQDILPYTFRHYTTFADTITLHDGGSTDNTRQIATQYGVKVRDWVTDGVNDKLAKELKETCWKNDGADAVIVVDADELVYFPEGAWQTLASYDRAGVALVKPHGFEMFSERFPTTDGQIYDEVVMGCSENNWYNKPALFFPKRLSGIVFSAGAHEAWARLPDGTTIYSREQVPNTPPTFLLHCHHLGPVERIAARYKRQRERLSQTNVKNKWGNFDAPMKHALDKRAMIMAGLIKVIA